MKFFATFVLLLAVGLVPTHADSITDGLATELTLNSPIHLGPGVALKLATNLMTAQADTPYAASEPDSLTLSFASVIRAIGLEETAFGQTEIVDAADSPLAFLQSTIAIDDRASISISVNGIVLQPGDVINFGDVPVGATSGTFTITRAPEPSPLWLCITGLLLLGLMRWAQTNSRKSSEHSRLVRLQRS